MLFTPDPLTERLTLVWHDHFATSQLKVEDVAAMRAQNETFRRHARGPFGDLLRAMLRDPALLAWLDAPSNRKGKPNENLARELMELFTLGVGQYSEHDVKEAARALTGRTVAQGRLPVRPEWHDDGEKTILGKTARFDGDKLADHLLAAPGRRLDRLAWRFCDAFLGEGRCRRVPAVSELAERLRGDDLHVGRAVEMILRSELFFSARNLHARVSDPVGFVDRLGCGASNGSTRRRARCCWPSGPAGWARSCSSRPTWGDGRAAEAGCRAARSWRGPTSPRRWPRAA